MSAKRFLAFDYGEKFIGIAKGQSISNTASAWCVINNNKNLFNQINNLLKQFPADILVVGLPVDISGEPLFTTALAERFAVKLKKRFNLPIYFVDERYTTCDIKDSLIKNKKQRIDAQSAQLILQQFLNENGTYK